MPRRFITVERAIARAIKHGKIPRYYYKNGIKHKSNPYAIARVATGYYGTTHDIGMLHPIHKQHSTSQTSRLILKGNKQYISHMYKHLRHEHPSTKRRMRMI
jgi:hypothetical protein